MSQITNKSAAESPFITGEGQTVGAVTADIITLDLGSTPSTYTLQALASGFESATPSGTGGQAVGVARTDGASATLGGSPNKVLLEEAALTTSNIDIVVSGNNAIVRVTGVAGLTINWAASLLAIRVV